MAIAIVALTAGCSNLPSSGPSVRDFVDNAKSNNPIGFSIVDVTPQVIDALHYEPIPAMGTLQANNAGTPADTIGVGDVLSLSIYSAGPGLFGGDRSTPQGGAADSGVSHETLPALMVDGAGNVTVPYVGKVHVAGLTAAQAQARIEGRLHEKSIQPQVIVNVATKVADTVIIYGEVKSPGRFPLSLAHERLLDMIAIAGGSPHPSGDLVITLIRGGRATSERMDLISDHTEENVRLIGGDRIRVDFQPRTFTVFGAGGKVSEIPFTASSISLDQGVARAGGPSNFQADPAGIYLFRYVPPEISERLGMPRGVAPVIFHVDLNEPYTYFAMQKLEMKDHDLIYIANSGTDQLQKFLSLIGQIFGPAATYRNFVQ
ncbi:MAG TPA: polysaccharide biosynthesis/export family protein [Stellaceae bacterium]|nr:polysaccharide biosynthesis/export family protein [Stellaceae bacterium]